MQAADPWERVTKCWRRARFSTTKWPRERMAEKSVGKRSRRRRNIEPGRIQALGEVVNDVGADGVLANNRPMPTSDDRIRSG
jgi:hypothetical protein